MKLTGPCSLLLIASTAFAHGQPAWQTLQMPSAEEVQRTWVIPPSEYGPEPYYGLNGAVDLTVVQRDLDTMKQLGYGAVTVQAGYDMPFTYLSPEYFQFFRSFVAEVKKRGMKVWIVDDAGYPSGFAGGKFSELYPELRMQGLAVAARIPVTGGKTVRQAVGADTVSVTATDTNGKILAIPIVNRSIDWTAPPGDWTVAIVEHRFMTSPTRSDTNPKRVKDGSQSLEDYMNPAATAQYLAFTHEQYRKAVGDEFGKTILGFRGDEPDYSIAGLPWTPLFFDTFEQRKGYDVRPYLASFLPPKGSTPAMSEAQKRARADYYDVFSQMFRDGFFKPQGIWCAQNNLEYQVHLNHEEMEMQLTRSEGDFFRDMRYVEVPGIDAIWHQIWTDTVSDYPRLASSAAHMYGHPRAFTESFAAYRPEPDVTLVRYILNEQFARGVNLVETMYFPASTGGHGGPAKYMQDPAYPALMAYVRRVSYLMSMGRPDASVALFLPSSSMWLGDAAADTAFVSTERLLSEHQIDFDIVDEDALSDALSAGPGTLTTMSGNRFRTVIVPAADVLSDAAVGRLKTFTQGGGHVLFLDRAPSLIAGRTILDAHAATAADFAWATILPNAQLGETPTPPAYPPAAPPAPQAVPASTLAAIQAACQPQEIALDRPDTALRYTRRKWKDAEIYLFFNEGATSMTHTLSFVGKTARAQEWNAESGSIRDVGMKPDGDRTAVALHLGPYETRILVVR